MRRASILVLLFAAAAILGHLDPAHGQARPGPDSIQVDKDVVYINGGKVLMDVARPTTPGPHPAVVTIGGDAFRTVTRSTHEALIRRLAGRGYVAAAIDYRVGARRQFPAPLQDVKAAVRFLRANAERFGIDPARICALGESAGAPLALLAALTPGIADFDSGANRDLPSALSCVVALSAVSDFSRAYTGSMIATESYPPLLGGEATHSQRAHALASPVNWVTPQAPPLLAVHASSDEAVPSAQSETLAESYRAAGAMVELVAVKGSAHGLALLAEPATDAHVLAFLDRHLGLAPPVTTVIVADHGARRQLVALDWPTGRELWTIPNAGGHDVQPLPNGNVLFTMGPEQKVVEIDKDRKEVWSYGGDEGLQHPISAERLANGHTLIGDAVLGRVIEVDRNRNIVWTYESGDLARMRMRNVRRTAAGTTLIANEAAGTILEVDQAGQIVWSYQTVGERRLPYKARRLANGNTLVTMTNPGELVEVDRAGTIVRTVGGATGALRLIWCSGFDILPNGNVLLSDYLGRRLLELTPSGAVAQEVRMPSRTTASIAVVR